MRYKLGQHEHLRAPFEGGTFVPLSNRNSIARIEIFNGCEVLIESLKRGFFSLLSAQLSVHAC
jgi:hypothetical protein